MNLGLWDVEDLLILMHKELSRMQDALEKQSDHSPGGFFTKKALLEEEPPRLYYRYTQNGIRCVKRVYNDELENYQVQIATLKERQAEKRNIQKKLKKVEKCFKALQLDYAQANKEAAKVQKQDDNEKKAFYPEGLRHLTLRGEYVRSKSEALLANLFFYYGIPYEYEKAVTLNGHVIHPDFTILLPDGTYLFWEHLGMLSDPNYAKKWAIKHQTYMECGIAEGNGLIITRDQDGVFDEMDALMKIKTYCRAFLKEASI